MTRIDGGHAQPTVAAPGAHWGGWGAKQQKDQYLRSRMPMGSLPLRSANLDGVVIVLPGQLIDHRCISFLRLAAVAPVRLALLLVLYAEYCSCADRAQAAGNCKYKVQPQKTTDCRIQAQWEARKATRTSQAAEAYHEGQCVHFVGRILKGLQRWIVSAVVHPERPASGHCCP
eukprot:gnl/TRDRNA2_/TRDRNA2_128354_c2_seq1.p1 gnl/TRDRNA2_/TRDRNA2_128354_c2~~gnl/TRDRNA2_/TRDRNA2_128354_c2_seq1.p1  ORF type:complete len:173 (-),score=0.39 gnl/TRDRNA2_/TRDRNA2_128354_c2_seq1:517-1035(-)